MGRQYFLHRMALGRSAYEPGDAIVPTTSTDDEVASGHYIQQYDSKGNPCNPAIAAFRKAQRDAQNEALLLTGIVERKERFDRQEELNRTASSFRTKRLLVEEHESGDLLDSFLAPMSFFSHMWLGAFIKRIQIGAYDPSLSILSILNAETKALNRPGESMKLSLARRFPALGDILLQFFVHAPLILGGEELCGRLQLYIQSLSLGRKTTRRLHMAIKNTWAAILILIDVAFIPMEFYANAQALSLIPPLPLIPPRSFFWPTGPASFHAFGWDSFRPTGLMSSRFTAWTATALLTSPAVLLFIHRLIKSEMKEDEFPICEVFTSFKWPEMNDPITSIVKPGALKDPLGWAMYQLWSTRTKILQWAGWRVVKFNLHVSADADLENDILLDGSAQPVSTRPFHRSTNLAHIPANILANAVDALFKKLVFLPFESLMLRSVAYAVMKSSIPGNADAGRGLYAPFGGPLSRIGRPGGLAEVGAYASRLGLGILLNVSVDVVLFFGACRLAKSIGVRQYGWGEKNAHGSGVRRARLEDVAADVAPVDRAVGQ